MVDDPRSSLRRADQLAREGELAEAIAIYQAVAEYYIDFGFLLKAIALSRQIVQIIDGSAPELEASRLRALERLVTLYSQLGLHDDAEKARQLLASTDAV